MSSIPPATTDPTPPASAALGPVAPIETPPSPIVAEGPTFARIVGFIGLFGAVLGLVVIVTTRAVGPRWVPEGFGYIFGGLGLALMLYHAIIDGEQEVRRMYGMLAALLLLVGVAFGVLPGPFESGGVKETGYYLVPWGLAAGLLALLFGVPFTRHETDTLLRDIALYTLLGVGGVLCVGVAAWGIFINPDFLTGPGIPLAVLGIAFICAFLSQTDTSEGLGYTVAFALGALGGAVLFYAFARTVFPTVLFEGPNALRKANQSLDRWRALGRALVILVALGVVALGALGRFSLWLRATLAGVGIIVAGVFLAASFGTQLTVSPKPFLVPGGLILGAIGLVYLAVSLGVCSESQFVTLTRRELSAYFFSPIGYLVIAGMAMTEGLAYMSFVERLAVNSAQGGAIPEPIVRMYIVSLWPVLGLTVLVPLLTMRLVSEERRTGSIEVLFTVPVSEWVVIISKFLATWVMFMLCWVPMGLFLIVLRVEGGAPFDYRPLLGFYVALAVTGAGFVAMGLFFSTITKNQIIAGVLTAVVMFFLLFGYLVGEGTVSFLGPTVRLVMKKVSYLDVWTEALGGQLPVQYLFVWASVTVLWIFLSIKVLEARRWS